MKNSDFQDLLKSIDQAREIHKGKRSPSRVFRFNSVEVKKIRHGLHISQP